MGPRAFTTNPAPQTEAARAQLQSFFCTLCNKGYARQNEFAAHEASYEHNHAQRRVDLRRLNAQMSQSSSSRRGGGSGGREDDGIIRMQVNSSSSNGTKSNGGPVKKKVGFKSAFVPIGVPRDEARNVVAEPPSTSSEAVPAKEVAVEDEDVDDDGYELYDPRHPTDCGPTCSSKVHGGT